MASFDFFFNRIDYHLSLGKGFSVYSTRADTWMAFLTACKQKNISVNLLVLSKMNPKQEINLIGSSVTVIIQDLDLESYQKQANYLADRIVFPLWYHHQSIVYFSVLSQADHSRKTIQAGDIHTNYSSVVTYLLCEQINALLSQINATFSTPDFLQFDPAKTILTPIEQKMAQALEQAALSYESQVRIGRYFVDFLVSVENRKLIVECDGRAYHDPVRDAERDKVLSAEGYPILRFSGSEIWKDAAGCVKRIQQTGKRTGLPNFDVEIDLDTDQRKAVGFVAGPIRVLAPAGSGKTKTLTNRIAHLINQGVAEDRILALAFNTKAREEMQNRLAKKHIESVEVRTFHSLGMEVVRKGLRWNFQGSAENKMTREILRGAVSKYVQLPARRNKDPLDAFLDALRKAKMELPAIDTVDVEYEDKIYPFEAIFNLYLQRQTERNFFNFDDMIYLAVRVLLDQDAMRREYQNQFEYILVDEFQDLNRAQLLLLQILSLPANNVFVVGDDDQMIYGWRGAEVRHIIDFHKRFSVVQDCVLSTNYRSSKKIVRHSRWLIDHNHDRIAKDIHARAGAQEGMLEITPGENLLDQAQKAAEWISRQKSSHNLAWKDFAVLYRYNAFEFPVAIALDACNIPHTPVNGLRLFQTRVGRDIYAYLSVILHSEDAAAEDFGKVLERPNKYFTNKIIATARNWNSFRALPDLPDLRHWEQEKLNDFVSRIETLRAGALRNQFTPSDFVSVLANEMGLASFYKDQSKLSDDLDEASDEMLLEILLSVSRSYRDLQTFYQAAHQAIYDETGGEKKPEEHRKDEVSLSTIHKAKGKEYMNVVFYNLSQNGKRDKENTDQEEERRVAYVGVTRAKDNLMVTFLASKPSGFLTELTLNPEFHGMSPSALLAQKSILETKRSKLAHDLDLLCTKKEKIFEQFPELSGKAVEQNWSPGLFARLRVWWHEKRLRSAVQTVEQLELQSQELTANEIEPLADKIKTIQSELEFRTHLGKK